MKVSFSCIKFIILRLEITALYKLTQSYLFSSLSSSGSYNWHSNWAILFNTHSNIWDPYLCATDYFQRYFFHVKINPSSLFLLSKTFPSLSTEPTPSSIFTYHHRSDVLSLYSNDNSMHCLWFIGSIFPT